MITIERPGKIVSGYKPCGCNGHCPYGLPEGQCPGSSAMAWQSFVPDDSPPPPKMTTFFLKDRGWCRAEAMRPEDV